MKKNAYVAILIACLLLSSCAEGGTKSTPEPTPEETVLPSQVVDAYYQMYDTQVTDYYKMSYSSDQFWIVGQWDGLADVADLAKRGHEDAIFAWADIRDTAAFLYTSMRNELVTWGYGDTQLTLILAGDKDTKQGLLKIEDKAITYDITTVNVLVTTKESKTNGVAAGEKKALERAESYLSTSTFSAKGLKNQLLYEKFSESEASYAVEHCGANWNEQALKKAESYLSITAFSASGLQGQLEYEGFTTEEAAYAVEHCEADWCDQAAAKAKSYLSISDYTYQRMVDQLIYEGFTDVEAVYGAVANGLSG